MALSLSYDAIFATAQWQRIALKAFPQDDLRSIYPREQATLLRDAVASAYQLRTVLKARTDIMPALRHVVLGGLGDDGETVAEIAYAKFPTCMRRGAIGLTMLDLPHIQDLCQHPPAGHLALPGYPLKPASGVRIFTYHPRPFLRPSPTQPEQTPLVIGATNRYYYNATTYFKRVFDHTNLIDRKEMLDPLSEIIQMLHRNRTTVLVRSLESPPWRAVDLESVDVTGTTLELYNLVRMCDWYSSKSAGTKSKSSGDVDRPLSLDGFQSLLDSQIHQKWRGKVVFKNREDTPACASCGYLCSQEDESMLTFKH